MTKVYDEGDLARMAGPDLQRALLKTPDDLIAQALVGAGGEVRSAVLGNLSRRRKSDVLRRAARLEEEMSDRAKRSAVRNLVRNVFELAGPQVDAADASTKAAKTRMRGGAGGETPEEDRAGKPDLTPGAFGRLGEARGIVSAFPGISAHSGHIARCRAGMGGAVLVKSWLGQKPLVPRERIYKAICGQPAAGPAPARPRPWRPPGA